MPYRQNAFRSSDAPCDLAIDEDGEIGPVIYRTTEDAEEVDLVRLAYVLAGAFIALGVIAGFAAWHH
jgi:hypothetical protein